MAQELYQLQPKKSLGSVLARSSLFHQIAQSEKSNNRVTKHTTLKHLRHQKEIDRLFS